MMEDPVDEATFKWEKMQNLSQNYTMVIKNMLQLKTGTFLRIVDIFNSIVMKPSFSKI